MEPQAEETTQLLDLSLDDILTLWDSGSGLRDSMDRKRKYYEGEHAILKRSESYADTKQKTNLVFNWPGSICDAQNGSISPYQVSLEDIKDRDASAVESYLDLMQDQGVPTQDIDNRLNALTMGYAIELHSYDSDSQEIRITNYDPRDWVVVRDIATGNIVLAIHRVELVASSLYKGRVLDKPVNMMTVYSDRYIVSYVEREREDGKTEWRQEDQPIEHFYGRVPIVQWNTSSTYESIISDTLIGLCDEYNRMASAGGDDILKLVDAYLKIWGFNAESIKNSNIHENKILPFGDKDEGDADFITRTISIQHILDLLSLLTDQIHTEGKVPNVGKMVGATGSTSGIALKLAYTPMKQSNEPRIQLLEQGVRDRVELINAISKIRNEPILEDYIVTIEFIQPVNEIEQWQSIALLKDIVSHGTLLRLLTSIKDPQGEMAAIAAELEGAAFDTRTGEAIDPALRIEENDKRVIKNAEQLSDRIQPALDALSENITDAVIASIERAQSNIERTKKIKPKEPKE